MTTFLLRTSVNECYPILYSLPTEQLCMIFSSADIFSKSTFSKNSFRSTIRVSNKLESDQARPLVGPDPGPNCLQKSSADGTFSRQLKS